MPSIHIQEETIDDAMRTAIGLLKSDGRDIAPTKGPAKELFGTLIEISNPHARLSRTESRGKIFSCIGEWLWCISGSDRLEFIQYYLSLYEQFSVDGKVDGTYGPRLLNWDGA